MNSTFNKIWWKLHKKPSSPTTLYWVGYFNAMVTGFIATVSVGWFIAAYFAPDPRLIAIGVITGVFAVGLAIFDYKLDKRRGYMDAQHQRYLERRDEIGRSLGKVV